MDTCELDECGRPFVAKGLCSKHYQRLIRHGDPNVVRDPYRPRNVGKGWVTPTGYKVIVIDGKRIFEHRHVMQEHLGRELLPEENVHHKNGDRLDNTLDNLELWLTKQPRGQRAEDAVEYARQILERYAPHYLTDEQ